MLNICCKVSTRRSSRRSILRK